MSTTTAPDSTRDRVECAHLQRQIDRLERHLYSLRAYVITATLLVALVLAGLFALVMDEPVQPSTDSSTFVNYTVR